TQSTTRVVAMATIRARKIRSVPDTRTRPPERRGAALAGVAGTVGRSLIGASPAPEGKSGGEDGLLLALQALGQPVDIVGVLEEGLDAGEHHRGREVGPGVAVQE